MPDPRRTTCQSCGRHKEECGPISWAGLCMDCAKARLTENIVGIATMSGEPAKRWRRSMAASVGAVLLDDVQANP